MNIKITKEEFDGLMDILQSNEYTMRGYNYNKITIGSRMYGTNREDSDTDVLIVHDSIFSSDLIYKNYHQLQYDDTDNNIQYIFTTKMAFWGNLLSGDSSINADVIMFSKGDTSATKLNICRTYNIIKSFIGFAKRDIKYANKGKNKLFHIERSLYCAECLMNNELPDIKLFPTFGNKDIAFLKAKESDLRSRCNKMFESNELTMYPFLPIVDAETSLERKIIEANNIKEFRY